MAGSTHIHAYNVSPCWECLDDVWERMRWIPCTYALVLKVSEAAVSQLELLLTTYKPVYSILIAVLQACQCKIHNTSWERGGRDPTPWISYPPPVESENLPLPPCSPTPRRREREP